MNRFTRLIDFLRPRLGGVIVAFTLGASAQIAIAQTSAQPLAVTLTVSRVQLAPDATESLVEARSANPGDLLEYRAVYANRGGVPLSGVVANLPLPAGLEFQSGSAAPIPVLASTDGAEFRPFPLMRTAVRDGKEVREQVPYSEYRALRWQLGVVAAGAEVVVKARAKVSMGAVAALAAPAK